MPRKRGDMAYIWDMMKSAKEISGFTEGKVIADFMQDRMLQCTIERLLEIIGESANRVSFAFQENHPEIPWRKIISLRNVLAHEYNAIDYEIVWNIAAHRIPDLLALLEQILPPNLPQVDL